MDFKENRRPIGFLSVGLVIFTAFGVGLVTWWLLPVGAAAILAAWFYTGGPRPYGYAGFGEVFVFVFFGLVAVLGTTYVQAERLSWPAVGGAVGIGMLACALLVANNLRDISTDTVVGKRTLAVLLGDRRTRQLYAVLLNLVSNAVRHARSEVRLDVQSGAEVQLRVTDDGPGIPLEDRERVFERFVRRDDARSRDAGGSGLGLAIVAELVARAHGRVHLEDPPGGGLRAVVVLPREDFTLGGEAELLELEKAGFEAELGTRV